MKEFRRRYTTIILIAAVALFALWLGSCSNSAHGPNDLQIASAIDAKLYQNPDLKALSVNVTSKQGVVTLSGTVNSPREKLTIEDLARKTGGVKQVVDNLTVASASSVGTPGAAASSEEASPAIPRPHHHRRRSHGAAVADNQAPPANQEAQNESQPTQDNTEPAQDNSPQVQDGVQPAGTDSSAPLPAPASAPAAAPAPQTPPASPPPAPPPQQVTIPSGTVVSVRMIEGISSGTAQPGQIYKASLFAPVVVNNQMVVPRGANARVRVVEVQSAGHFQGQPLLKVELAGFKVNGVKYSVKSDYLNKVGQSRTKNSAEKVGGGAAVGALLSALIGRGKGAGIGAAIGGGAGAVDQGATQAPEVKIPSEARIDFILKSPVSVTLSAPASKSEGGK